MQIEVIFSDKLKRDIPLIKGMSLYHTLQNENIIISAPCAGRGTCGACKIQLLEGSLLVTEKDKMLLTDEELKNGWRLACQAYPEQPCKIFVPTEVFTAVTEYPETNKNIPEDTDYAIAIDLGTTTLAYELFSMESGKTCRVLSSTNPQRSYGADVVSRMEQSNNGRKALMKQILIQEMQKDISLLIKDINPESLKKIGISGNTVMIHLLMGYSCETLGRYPFAPVTLDRIDTDAEELGLLSRPVPVSISPGISAYVGGDVLIGAAVQAVIYEKNPCLFLDLGTNAEMMLTDGAGKAYVTSAPAGPAFEAANISCGVGSVDGAVSGMTIENGEIKTKTIQGKAPVGFCGSGILEAVYELLKNNLVDETGMLADSYFEKGYPVGKLRITQNDIRQIQLAKSAVFSAIRILLKEADISAEEIQKVYLAGGFGYFLNIEKAIGIGLLPRELKGKTETIGNASLRGTKAYLTGSLTDKEIYDLRISSEEKYLSQDADFQAYFIENLNFDKNL